MERNNQRVDANVRGAKQLHEGKPMDAMKNDACRNAAMTRCDEGHRKQDMELNKARTKCGLTGQSNAHACAREKEHQSSMRAALRECNCGQQEKKERNQSQR
mmetsp:Transcript_12288/g.31888  ORF Transcript_12288/g.31888 Transcript_12288/m.31888 type:complete len:102 (+) Transcript_12288:975-1280(+)